MQSLIIMEGRFASRQTAGNGRPGAALKNSKGGLGAVVRFLLGGLFQALKFALQLLHLTFQGIELPLHLA